MKKKDATLEAIIQAGKPISLNEILNYIYISCKDIVDKKRSYYSAKNISKTDAEIRQALYADLHSLVFRDYREEFIINESVKPKLISLKDIPTTEIIDPIKTEETLIKDNNFFIPKINSTFPNEENISTENVEIKKENVEMDENIEKELIDSLINEENISYINKKQDEDDFNIKKLLNNPTLSQRQSIRIGNIFQKWVKKIVTIAGASIIDEHYADIDNSGTQDIKGKKDMDILFNFNNKIYYFEIKTNLNLDSEKSKETDKKINTITNWLKIKNPNIDVISGALSCWYCKEEKLMVKITSPIFYMKDIFLILNIDWDKDKYYKFLENFGKKLNIEKE